MTTGSLTVVGTGMRLGGHLTPEARASIENAEKLFYLETDAAAVHWLKEANPTAESLRDSYAEGKVRSDTYAEIVERILAPVRAGQRVCAAFNGHPGYFVHPSHEAVRIARAEGHRALMLPGISSLDCLVSDLGVDPAVNGCQLFEATDFVLCKRRFDPRNKLILLQVGAVGVVTWKPTPDWGREGLAVLTEVLLEDYPADHRVTVYETFAMPMFDPVMAEVELAALPEGPVTVNSTLYVPPLGESRPDPERLRRLGLEGHAR